MLRPTPGDPLGVEQHHWNTGAEENQQLKLETLYLISINKFIEIKYSVSNGLVIFITNYWWISILEISRYRRSNRSVLKDTR